MLVRNLRKVGDYERSILSQEENLRMAISNDRNIAQARSQARQGMVPELTQLQQRSKEEELTDAIAIQAKAQENLLSLYPKEQVAKFMAGLTTEDMTYLNVYWNDLKPVFKTKTGLNKTYFDRILKKHIESIVDSRGMSTVPSSGYLNASLNEIPELKRAGIYDLRDSLIIRKIVSRLGSRGDPKSLEVKRNLERFKSFLPSQAILKKVAELPEAERSDWIVKVMSVYRGIGNNQAWEAATVMDNPAPAVELLFPILSRAQEFLLEEQYAKV